MTCSGCSGAVTRVLSKLQGVTNFDVSLETQKVVVEATIPQEQVFQAIQKTGKATRFVSQSN